MGICGHAFCPTCPVPQHPVPCAGAGLGGLAGAGFRLQLGTTVAGVSARGRSRWGQMCPGSARSLLPWDAFTQNGRASSVITVPRSECGFSWGWSPYVSLSTLLSLPTDRLPGLGGQLGPQTLLSAQVSAHASGKGPQSPVPPRRGRLLLRAAPPGVAIP